MKEIDLKLRRYYFFNDMIIMKISDPNKIKIDEKSYKQKYCYFNIGYVMIKNLTYVKINCVNPLYFIIDKINGCIEENNGDKYLTLVPTDERKKV